MSKTDNHSTIILSEDDLNFQVRFETVADKLGYSVTLISEFRRNEKPESEFDLRMRLMDFLSNLQPVLVIIDLNAKQFPWLEWIPILKSDPATRRIPLICFGSNKETQDFKSALQSGADQVYARPKEKSELAHPHEYPLAEHKGSHHVAQMIKEGRQKISVYIRHYYNGCYSNPDAETWREVYLDEKLIPFHVSMDTFMSEATALSDLILPETTYLERFDIENMPSSIETPWVGIRQPVVKPLGECKSYRDIVLELVTKHLDPTGSRGVKKYFDYGTTEDYIKYMAESVPGVKEAGGWAYLKKNGVWSPKPVGAEHEYGLYKKGGFGTKDKKINIYAEEWAKHGFNRATMSSSSPNAAALCKHNANERLDLSNTPKAHAGSHNTQAPLTIGNANPLPTAPTTASAAPPAPTTLKPCSAPRRSVTKPMTAPPR